MYKFLFVFLLLGFVGCDSVSQGVVYDYSSMIDVSTAVAENIKDEVDVPDDDENAHQREDCPHRPKGVVTNGDGHTSPCQDCRPRWSEQEIAMFEAAKATLDKPEVKQESTPEVKEVPGRKCSPYCKCKDDPCPCANQEECFLYNKLRWETANKKCCPECPCENCTCMYPGQCLVEQNKGRDYIVYKPGKTTYEYVTTGCNRGSCDTQRVAVQGPPVEVRRYQSPESRAMQNAAKNNRDYGVKDTDLNIQVELTPWKFYPKTGIRGLRRW